MSNIIGPIPQTHWRILQLIATDIRWRRKARVPFDEALAKDIKVFWNILKKYLTS